MVDWSTVERVQDDVPELPAAAAAAKIVDDATMTVSGFGSVGFPKAIPLALADSERDLSLMGISGGSVGEEIDTTLVEADAIARRFPYQATAVARRAVNAGEIALHDRHIGGLADEVVFEQLASPDVAIVEAVAAGEDWLVPSTSIGHTPAYVEQADTLFVEVNTVQPRDLAEFHDVYRPEISPRREPIPLTEPGERIGDAMIRFDPGKLAGIVRTDPGRLDVLVSDADGRRPGYSEQPPGLPHRRTGAQLCVRGKPPVAVRSRESRERPDG